jgi:D-cysteine desulfhydrase
LWVKRDDLMGVGGGGNKLRKLELLIGDALAQGCDTFITTGGLQSNHARQSAAAAARAGLACELMLADMVTYQEDAYTTNGNLLLDDLFGAAVHRLEKGTDPMQAAQQRASEIAGQGGKAYVVGAGGSSPLGCLGYVGAAAEILEQERALGLRFGSIVVPNGSCGTHAGLVAGLTAAQDEPSRVLSFTVLAPLEEALSQTRLLARQTLDLIGPELDLPDSDVVVDGTQRGDSYGAPTAAMVAALRIMARSEGLLLDPVYSGKAFAGVLEFAHRQHWAGQDVLFIMTGGTPGLFAYREAISTP